MLSKYRQQHRLLQFSRCFNLLTNAFFFASTLCCNAEPLCCCTHTTIVQIRHTFTCMLDTNRSLSAQIPSNLFAEGPIGHACICVIKGLCNLRQLMNGMHEYTASEPELRAHANTTHTSEGTGVPLSTLICTQDISRN